MMNKVLLVDDEVDFLEAMSARLENRGMEVSAVSRPEEALEKIAEESFDAVVLDLQMPGMDGIETLKKIKALKPELHIILLTGHATVQKGIEAMKLGAMDLMEKPADMNALLDRIKRAKAEKIILVEKKNEERIQELLTRKGW